jgi:hypothetical protein
MRLSPKRPWCLETELKISSKLGAITVSEE